MSAMLCVLKLVSGSNLPAGWVTWTKEPRDMNISKNVINIKLEHFIATFLKEMYTGGT